MKRGPVRQLKKQWRWKPLLSFPSFTVSIKESRDEIRIRVFNSEIPEEGEVVDGFLFEIEVEVEVTPPENGIDEEVIVDWIRGNRFHSLLKENLENKVLKNFTKWFPYMDLSRSFVTVDVMSHYKYKAEFGLWIQFEVLFEKGIPPGRFRTNIHKFSKDFFDTKKFDTSIDLIIRDVIFEEFPNVSIGVYNLSSYDPQPKEIKIIREGPWSRNVHDFSFPRYIYISIFLRKPLNDAVFQSLASSSSEEEFFLKLSMYVEDIREIEVVPYVEREIETIGDVIEFIKEITGRTD